MDAVRGASVRIKADSTEAESSSALTSFDSDGFTVNGTSLEGTNKSSGTYVAWNWKAGGSGSSNSDGSITSTVSANTTAGFSIVGWTGSGANATIGHGLGVAPKMIIIRRRTGSTTNWKVYHESIGNDNELNLNETSAKASSTRFQSTSPTSSVFSVSSNSAVNESSQSIIAYCFAEKKGYSKMGAYRGSSGNSFIYTGFKPAFLLVKSDSYSSGNWRIFDNKRSTSGFNVIDDSLRPNTNAAEIDETSVDFLSNGFKYRANVTDADSGGTDYIYYAVAENPFVGNDSGTAVPVTAR